MTPMERIEGELSDAQKRIAELERCNVGLVKECQAQQEQIAELKNALTRQAKAAQQGMDAAKAVASSELEQAKRLYAECSPEALESEREANAKLTELVAELERERDAYRAAEEHQIALRQKMEEREAALAAHVERLQEAGDKLREPWDLSTVLGAETRRRIEGWDKARAESPVTSLARRDSHPDCELECGAYGTYCKCAAEKSQQAAWDKEEEDLKKVRDGKMSTNTFRRIHFPELAASSKTEDHQ
nr:hypothetical protein [uncultured Halomonas sp.]